MPVSKSAKRQYDRERYTKQGEKIRKRSREWYFTKGKTPIVAAAQRERERKRSLDPAYRARRNARGAAWRKANWSKSALGLIRRRARVAGLAFDLVAADIPMPEFCPVLGIRLVVGKGRMHDASPTVDRVDNTKGYTKDNVVVVSNRANRLKGAATIEELKRLFKFYTQTTEDMKHG